ncbi:MAG: DsbA family oxidoreductase [Pseudomonadota bacterium]
MTINVTVTSDFICPWCLIGERRLFRAIEGLPAEVDVEVQWRPFELNPDMPKAGMDRRTYRSRKFGSWERSQALDANTVTAAKADGVTLDYDRITRTPNTFAAHRLAWLAAQQGVQHAVVTALLEAYFVEGRDVGDVGVLAEIADEGGIDPARARAFLESEEGVTEVQTLLADVRLHGIHGVPHFDIEGLTVTGAQRPELLRQAILDVHARQEAA